MATRDLNIQPERDFADRTEEEGLDFERLRELVGFGLGAVRRRPKTAAVVFVAVAGIGLAVAAILPRTYNSEVKLLAQNNLVVPWLSNPGRAVPRDADDPTRNVADTILRRDNLVALANEVNLVPRYYATRGPALKLKDRLLGGPKNDEDKLRGLVGTLEKKLVITTNDSTVTIGVDWPDPQMAYDLVARVQKNFLEARYDDQVAMIKDAISVLEEHAAQEAEQIDLDLDDYEKLTDASAAASASTAAAAASAIAALPHARPRLPAVAPAAAPRPAVDPDLARALEAKRRQIRALEQERQQALDSLKQQLAQLQLTLTPQHPSVIALQQRIDSVSQPDPELAQLRDEERNLMAQIAPPQAPVSSSATHAVVLPSTRDTASSGPAAAPSAMATAASSFNQTADQNPHKTLAHSKLEAAVHRYQDVMARIDAANIELDIARTAFKYRYTVVTPAEVPRGPKRPVALLVAIASVLGALLLALLAAAGLDASSGRIFETWQVRRKLKLDVLGELDGTDELPVGPP